MSNTPHALGRHLITELYNCTLDKLDDVALVEQIMTDAAKAANATIVSISFHHFMPYGVSGVIVIEESHLAIHTWPEYGFASLDLFTCGEATDPWRAVGFLEKAFGASHSSTVELSRGVLPLLTKKDYQPIARSKPLSMGINRQNWHTEHGAEIAISFSYDELLHRRESAYQKLEVYHTKAWGRALVINDKLALTEHDEAAYHEMAIHVPLSLIPQPKQVLIIGGGDGGMAKECLKHPSVEQVTVLERDKELTELAQRFFPSLTKAFGSPKIKLICMEAEAYLAALPTHHFDLIVIDGIVPEGDWASFHQLSSRWLAPRGLYLTSIASPRLAPQSLVEQLAALRSVFGTHQVHLYNTFLPSCPTGMWTFGLAPLALPHLISRTHDLSDCHYYNDQVHAAAFALPNFMKQILSPTS